MICGAMTRLAASISGRGSIMAGGRTARRWHCGPVPTVARSSRSSSFAEDLDQIPLGPARGGIEPAAHLRLGVRGETIVRLETRLGYTHKGTLGLMRGKSPRAAARFAARLAGEATVAHSIAFARATEAALGCEVPRGHRRCATSWRRLNGSFTTWTFSRRLRRWWGWRCCRHALPGTPKCSVAPTDVAFGHRLMMDCVLPGGVAADIVPGGPEAIGRALSALAAELPDLRLRSPDGQRVDRARRQRAGASA